MLTTARHAFAVILLAMGLLNRVEVKSTQLSIVSGSTTAKSSLQKGQKTSLRAGLMENGNSVISVYKGGSKVESAGQVVSIGEGMGLKVKKGQAPPKPIKLLKSTKLTGQDHTFNYANPVLSWSPVSLATAYQVEICAEIDCDHVMLQHRLEGNDWLISGLDQSGQFFWCVAAVDVNDIVGFRSQSASLFITNEKIDQRGPLVVLDVVGPKQLINGVMAASNDSQIVIVSHDRLSGVKSVYYRWDNQEWLSWRNQTIDINVTASVFSVKAMDNLGYELEYNYPIN